MKKYLYQMWKSGCDLPSTKIIKALDDEDVFKRIYVEGICGCDSIEEFEEDYERSYEDLDVEDCKEDLDSNEDILMFIVDSNLNFIYKRGEED